MPVERSVETLLLPPQAEGPSAGPQYRDGYPGRGHAQRLQVSYCGWRADRAHPQGGDTTRESHLLPGLGEPSIAALVHELRVSYHQWIKIKLSCNSTKWVRDESCLLVNEGISGNHDGTATLYKLQAVSC